MGTTTINGARARARIARSAHAKGANHPDTIDAKRDYYAQQLEEHIRATVAKAPPLTEVQKTRLSAIINGGAQ